ncbi:MAG: hypothetical protein PHH08_04390 [Candidatus ainarchaeum sp.]|nr:hypothetical protein [Candidatus ainarchaeum sp.]
MAKDCKLVCDNKTVAVFEKTKDGHNVKWTAEGKKLCREMCKCFEGCC